MGRKFNLLEKKIEKGELKAHPGWSVEHAQYVAKATAGQIARRKGYHR